MYKVKSRFRLKAITNAEQSDSVAKELIIQLIRVSFVNFDYVVDIHLPSFIEFTFSRCFADFQRDSPYYLIQCRQMLVDNVCQLSGIKHFIQDITEALIGRDSIDRIEAIVNIGEINAFYKFFEHGASTI